MKKTTFMLVLSLASLITVNQLATAEVNTLVGLSLSSTTDNWSGKHWVFQSEPSDYIVVDVEASFAQGQVGNTLLSDYNDGLVIDTGYTQAPHTPISDGEECAWYSARTWALFQKSASGAPNMFVGSPWVARRAPAKAPDYHCP